MTVPSSYSCVPDTQAIPMRTRNHIIMLSVPFHLSTGITPICKSDDSPVIISHAQIPTFDGTVDTRGSHKIGIPCMPIDIGDGTSMRKNETRKARRWRSRAQIPNQEFLRRCGQYEVGCNGMRGPLTASIELFSAI